METQAQYNPETIILKVENLSCYNLKNEQYIIEDISFNVKDGETIGLLGESGAGKTTLIRAILNLLPEDEWKVSGKISVNDEDITHHSPYELEKIRGSVFRCIFQEPSLSLNPSLKIGYQLKEVVKQVYKELAPQEVKVITDNALKIAGLKEPELFYNKYPGELSGGQRQRVGIAISLSCSCDLLFADEPSNSLDSVTVTELIKSVRKLKDDRKIKSIFCITHDLSVLKALECDRVLFMSQGKILDAGNVDEALNNPSDERLKKLIELAGSVTYMAEHKREDKIFNSSILDVQNLSFGYQRKSFFKKEKDMVLQDMELVVKQGEFVGLVGCSGCGKSTIGKILTKQESDYVGEILFKAENIAAHKSAVEKATFYQGVQMVFQDSADTFDPSLTVHKNLQECFDAMGLDKEEIEKRIKRLMGMLNLEERLLDEVPGNLSGGQKQRFALIRAFGADPKLIIADEPFTHLDLITQNQLVEYLIERKNDENDHLSCILVSHEIGLASKLCDRLVVIEDGKIIEDENAHKIIASPQHAATKKLINAARMLGTVK